MKLLDKIKSIKDGYSNLLFEDTQLEPLFKDRYKICKSCEHYMLGICNICGCVCKAKSHSRYENCPDNRWKPTIREDNKGKYILRSELPSSLHENFKNEVIDFEYWMSFIGEEEQEEDE